VARRIDFLIAGIAQNAALQFVAIETLRHAERNDEMFSTALTCARDTLVAQAGRGYFP
jgi:hypothetical protein